MDNSFVRLEFGPLVSIYFHQESELARALLIRLLRPRSTFLVKSQAGQVDLCGLLWWAG